MAKIGKDVPLAASLLEKGEVVAIPTETVYGLAANAFNDQAVAKIFEVKNRPATNPLIVHIGNKNQLDDLIAFIPENAKLLMQAFWPGPLTLLLPKKEIVSDLVTAGHKTVAVRMPAHPLLQELLEIIPFPLTAPSANPFTYISPTSVEHVAKQIGDKIPYILDGGDCEKGVESTIVGFNEAGEAVLYRLGAIPTEAIEAVLNSPLKTIENQTATPAPGMHKLHYSPSTPLFIVHEFEKHFKNYEKEKIGAIVLDDFLKDIPTKNQYLLSGNKDLEKAANQLYKALHFLDNLNLEAIFIKKFEASGLGKTLNDRLHRAGKELV